MEFIGEDGVPAQLLKEAAAGIKKSKWVSLYLEVICHMRTMYNKCKLVHGDLSEFNILYHKGNLFILRIDLLFLLFGVQPLIFKSW